MGKVFVIPREVDWVRWLFKLNLQVSAQFKKVPTSHFLVLLTPSPTLKTANFNIKTYPIILNKFSNWTVMQKFLQIVIYFYWTLNCVKGFKLVAKLSLKIELNFNLWENFDEWVLNGVHLPLLALTRFSLIRNKSRNWNSRLQIPFCSLDLNSIMWGHP